MTLKIDLFKNSCLGSECNYFGHSLLYLEIEEKISMRRQGKSYWPQILNQLFKKPKEENSTKQSEVFAVFDEGKDISEEVWKALSDKISLGSCDREAEIAKKLKSFQVKID
jgi:hypothetical protein